MNKEFHLNITHIVAAWAGLRGDELRVLVHASQLTDDNNMGYKIKEGRRIVYENRISQTLNPFRTKKKQLAVYPLFHFIPGDPGFAGAKRVDGETRPFNTTPDSENANRIIAAAISTNDFYQIGIASHAYADTWAHQNFVGFEDSFNGDSIDDKWLNLGHFPAGKKPDNPTLVWKDDRLIDPDVNNMERFMEAADGLLIKLWPLRPRQRQGTLIDARSKLSGMLDGVFLPRKNDRLKKYSEVALSIDGEETEIPVYTPKMWFKQAVKTKNRSIGSRNHGPRRTRTTYHFLDGYLDSDWYKFQEAVKAYAERTQGIICQNPEVAALYEA